MNLLRCVLCRGAVFFRATILMKLANGCCKRKYDKCARGNSVSFSPLRSYAASKKKLAKEKPVGNGKLIMYTVATTKAATPAHTSASRLMRSGDFLAVSVLEPLYTGRSARLCDGLELICVGVNDVGDLNPSQGGVVGGVQRNGDAGIAAHGGYGAAGMAGHEGAAFRFCGCRGLLPLPGCYQRT